MKKLQFLTIIVVLVNLFCATEVAASQHSKSTAQAKVSTAQAQVNAFMQQATYLPSTPYYCMCGQHCSGQSIQTCIKNCESSKTCLTSLKKDLSHYSSITHSASSVVKEAIEVIDFMLSGLLNHKV